MQITCKGGQHRENTGLARARPASAGRVRLRATTVVIVRIGPADILGALGRAASSASRIWAQDVPSRCPNIGTKDWQRQLSQGGLPASPSEPQQPSPSSGKACRTHARQLSNWFDLSWRRPRAGAACERAGPDRPNIWRAVPCGQRPRNENARRKPPVPPPLDRRRLAKPIGAVGRSGAVSVCRIEQTRLLNARRPPLAAKTPRHAGGCARVRHQQGGAGPAHTSPACRSASNDGGVPGRPNAVRVSRRECRSEPD